MDVLRILTTPAVRRPREEFRLDGTVEVDDGALAHLRACDWLLSEVKSRVGDPQVNDVAACIYACLSSAEYCVNESTSCLRATEVEKAWEFIQTAATTSPPAVRRLLGTHSGGRTSMGYALAANMVRSGNGRAADECSLLVMGCLDSGLCELPEHLRMRALPDRSVCEYRADSGRLRAAFGSRRAPPQGSRSQGPQ